MVDRSMRGLFPILAMPFDDRDDIDVEDLQREVDFAIDAGVDGLGLAFGSEVNRLSEAERDLAARTVIAQAAGRVPVVVNTGAESTRVAVEYSRRAEEMGADAVMAVPPAAAGGGDPVVEYFRAIGEALKIPVFIQDAGATGVAPALMARIARESENVCYAKVETPPTPPRIAETVAAAGDGLIVLGGMSGAFLIEEMRRGSVGTMPHCHVPDMFRRVIDLFLAGREDEAEREFNRHTPLFRLHGPHVNKEVLRLRGVFKSSRLRHPVPPADELTLRELRRLVEELGLARTR